MIDTALVFIRDQIRSYFINDLGLAGEVVGLGNIAFFETNQADAIDNQTVITLVNIEEESTLKNGKTYLRQPNGNIRHIRLPIHLNLYVLFSCNYPSNSPYEDSMSRLGNIILFFQLQNSFEVIDGDDCFKLNFELYTLTFEQINHLWGALGGRQLPSVMYKVRLVTIAEKEVFKVGPPIEEVEGTLHGMQ